MNASSDEDKDISFNFDDEEFEKQQHQHAEDERLEYERNVNEALDNELSSFVDSDDSDESVKETETNKPTNQYSQAEIESIVSLSESRNRQLNEAMVQVEKTKDELERKCRVFNHKVEITLEEKDQLYKQLCQAQNNVDTYKSKCDMAEHSVNTLQLEKCNLEATMEILKKKLIEKEKCIVDLNSYAQNLQSTDALESIRAQHMLDVEGLRNQCALDVEIWSRKFNELSVLNNELQSKNDHQYDRINILNKRLEQSNLERIETVERLSSTIKQTQERYQHLIQYTAPSTTGSDLIHVKNLENKISNSEKDITIEREKNKALVEQVDELNRQLRESETTMGILKNIKYNTHNSLELDDSFSQINPKQKPMAYSTPTSTVNAAEYHKIYDDMIKKQKTIEGLSGKLETVTDKLTQKSNIIDNMRISNYSQKQMLDLVEEKIGTFSNNKEFLDKFDKFIERLSQKITVKAGHIYQQLYTNLKRLKIKLSNIILQLTDMQISTQKNYKTCSETTCEINVILSRYVKKYNKKITSLLQQNEKYSKKSNKLAQEITQVKNCYVDLCQLNKELEDRLINNDSEQISILFEKNSRQNQLINDLQRENQQVTVEHTRLTHKHSKVKIEVRKKMDMMKNTCIEMVDKLKKRHKHERVHYDNLVSEMKKSYCFMGKCGVSSIRKLSINGMLHQNPTKSVTGSFNSNVDINEHTMSSTSNVNDYVGRIGEMRDNLIKLMEKFNRRSLD